MIPRSRRPTAPLPVDGLARAEERHALLESAPERLTHQLVGRLPEGLAIEIERAEVHGHHQPRPQIFEDLNGLLGIDVIGVTFVRAVAPDRDEGNVERPDRKSTRLNSSHVSISYAVFCLKKKNKKTKLILDSITKYTKV